jgi:hypothetical protein
MATLLGSRLHIIDLTTAEATVVLKGAIFARNWDIRWWNSKAKLSRLCRL